MDIQSITFSVLKDIICSETLQAIEEMGLNWPTEIQKRSIPHLLLQKDVIGVAKTGSGKTLAFLIPAVEYVYRKRFTSKNGTGCIIISPTRELAIQTYNVLKAVLKHHTISCGLLIGGVNREKEVESITKGLNIVVATIGRLLDHLRNTPNFFYKNLKLLILDEADKILDEGFQEEIKSIMKYLPRKNRQTVLFSATLNEKIHLLSKLSLQNEPVHVSVDSKDKKSTVEGLQQGYVLCPTEKRLWWLFKMLKKTKTQKVMVFLSSCKSVEFHRHLFEIFCDIPVMSIHGQQNQSKRTTTFSKFTNISRGVLFCTDVAARGLDIPAVDWIVQYDPPTDTMEYIHRVGRTARGEGSKGNAVLVLRPEEASFLECLKEARVVVNPYKMWNKIEDIQAMVENAISTNGPMKILARKAFLSFLRFYQAHPLKDIFKLGTLDLKALGKSFGFADPPHTDILTAKKKNSAKRKKIKKNKNQAHYE